jgi:hypothetical protein
MSWAGSAGIRRGDRRASHLGDDNGGDNRGGHLLALSGRKIRAQVRVGGRDFPNSGDRRIDGLAYGGDYLVG